MGDYKEQRVHPRVPMMVKVRDMSGKKQTVYFSREVSKGGLFLETCDEFEVGEELRLTFQIPGTEFEVRTVAKVMYTLKPRKGVKSPGIGVQFDDMDGRSEQLLNDYILKIEEIRSKLSQS